MICGLWFIAANGSDAAKVDLCPGKGQWRVQVLERHEYIIGMHSYVQADDESSPDDTQGREVPENVVIVPESEGSWIDSLGFIVYKFHITEPP